MNYRHAYHAGNHADVLKHIVLMRAFQHLKKKEKPFLFLDAHAGTGLYALWGDEALRTLEWRDGVGRLYDPAGKTVSLTGACEELISPWRQVITSVNAVGQPISHYPGSPGFALQALRRTDRIVLNELHLEDSSRLANYVAGDRRVKVQHDDAGLAIRARLPPSERRGIVLIDPPYEREDEARRAIHMLSEGCRRFATGVFLLWYPVTGDRLSTLIVRDVQSLALPKTLRAELLVRHTIENGGLAGSGLIIINPPWPIADEISLLGPALCERLRQNDGAQWSLDWLTA